jgi:thiosulfate/3-mercaptopyruvate sulfurtransferase
MPKTTLIIAAELAQNIENQQWIVLDCRHDLANLDAGRIAYAAGHIPGAQFAHLDLDLSDKSAGPNGEFRGRHPLPERSTFIQTLRRWGINDDTQVVAYDAHGGMYAARLWWMLRWVGHQSVAVLDGGIGTWTALNLPLSTESVEKASGHISDLPALVSTVSVDDLIANIANSTNARRTVVDARAPDRYRGENETLDPVGGHIPGAKNRFFKDNLQADGTFKPAEQLRTEFGAIVDDAANSVMQCGSGVTACHNLLALEVAGMSGAALYPGSWSEWCSNPARPVATGN